MLNEKHSFAFYRLKQMQYDRSIRLFISHNCADNYFLKEGDTFLCSVRYSNTSLINRIQSLYIFREIKPICDNLERKGPDINLSHFSKINVLQKSSSFTEKNDRYKQLNGALTLMSIQRLSNSRFIQMVRIGFINNESFIRYQNTK